MSQPPAKEHASQVSTGDPSGLGDRSFAVYVRRDGKVSGPFARGLVERYFELGRVRASDELSTDRENWFPAPEALPGVTPLSVLLATDREQPAAASVEEKGADSATNWARERRAARLRWLNERYTDDEPPPGADSRDHVMPSRLPPPHFKATNQDDRGRRRLINALVVAGLVAGLAALGIYMKFYAPTFVAPIRIVR